MERNLVNKKIVICGCHEYGYKIAENLLSSGVTISHFVSLTPEQSKQFQVSGYHSFESLSTKYKIPIYYPNTYSLNDPKDLDFFKKNSFDLLIVAGWQRLIPNEILETLSLFGLGLHGSSELLPKGRGRSPVNWSLIENKSQFILHLFILKPNADDGDVIEYEKFQITNWDDCRTLYYKISISATNMLQKTIPLIFSNSLVRHKQTGEASYYPKRTPEDGKINWNLSSSDIYNLIRAVTKPYPGAFTFSDSKKILIWKSKPFDDLLKFENFSVGQVIDKFSNGDFIVKCGIGTLLITDYEGVVNTHDNLEI